MNKNIFLFLVAVVVFSLSLQSQVPAGYYNGTEGLTGETLKLKLHDIIDNHTEYSYNNLRDFILRATDEDPDNSNNVILLYTGRSQAKSTFGGGVNDWNREHVWAKSHGDFGTSAPAGTDAHHIRPTDASVNSIRGNYDFDMGGNPVSEAPGCFVDGDSFEPRDAVKGDVARMIFYMATRYEGGGGEPDLEVVDRVNTYPNPEHGKLSVLLLWNQQDLPDDFERNRNDVIYYDYQHNRNPFIDHPEFADAIWGDPSSLTDTDASLIAVYPNPTTGSFTIHSVSDDCFYSVVSIYGHVIQEGQLSSVNQTISLADDSAGIFILNIFDPGGKPVRQMKVVKLAQ